MDNYKIILLLLLFGGCANQDWRHGNYSHDVKIGDKRQDERDKMMERAEDFRVGTAKHYIKEHKKHDGKNNFFIRDGFDWGF